MQSCECKFWGANMEQYNSMFDFVEKYHGPLYEGDGYSFCPWCGTDIRAEDEEEEGDDEDEIDTTPMHGGEEYDEDEEEEEIYEDDYELIFEPEILVYPVMLDGWVSNN